MSLIVNPWMSAFGLNVRPSDGAKLYFYEAGTTTPKTVYTDINETVAATNPVVADSDGRFDPIFLSGTYKIVLTDKNDVVQETVDNLQASQIAVNWIGDFDSSTNGGDYPASGSLGDLYRVTEKFILNAASGIHQLYLYDFLICNKVGATGIDADWNILKGKDWLIDEDDFVSNSDTLAPSQQSTKAYITSGTITLINKTIDSANNSITFDTGDANSDFTLDTSDANTDVTINSGDTDTSVTIDSSDAGSNLTIDSADANTNLTIDNGEANTTINSGTYTVQGVKRQFKRIILVAGADADHDIIFSDGTFTFIDGAGDGYSAGLTKQLDAVWAAGTNAGGLPTALSPANDTTYHCFALSNTTGTATDFGFDISLTASNLLADAAVIAAGLTKYRRVGSRHTDGSANFYPMYQVGKHQYFKSRLEAVDTTGALGTSAITGTLPGVPTGFQSLALLSSGYTDTSGRAVLITSLSDTDDTPIITSPAKYSIVATGATSRSVIQHELMTDASAQFRYRFSASPITKFVVLVLGFVDVQLEN